MEEKKKRWKPKKGMIVILILAAVVLILAVGVWKKGEDVQYQEVTVEERDITSYLEFSGNVEAVNTANVYAEAAAKISEVLVEEGDMVKAGDVIATLDSGDIEYNIQLKELALEQTKMNNSYNIKDSQSNLDNLNEQIDQGLNASLNNAEKALLSAQEAYLKAAETYNQTKTDYENGTLSELVSAKQTLDTQQMIYDTAKEQYDKGNMSDETFEPFEDNMDNAWKTYEEVKEGAKKSVDAAYDAFKDALDAFEDAQRDYDAAALTVDQNVESYENALERTKALSTEESSEIELEHLKESLADYTICAPIDGYVTRLDMKAGDYVSNAMAVAEVVNFDTMQVAIRIDEYDSRSVTEGDPVEIYVDALGLTYQGRISRISRVATVMNDVSYLDAVVEFEADDQVYSGFSAEVKLVKEAQTAVPALPVGDISYDVDNTAYVLIRDAHGDAVKQPVTVGVSDGAWVHIREGLSVGDVILTVPSVYEMLPMGAMMR